MKKKFMALIMVTLLMISLIGCGKSNENGKIGDTIKIGVLYSTTGDFSISETPMLNAAKMAIDEINEKGGIKGTKIEAIYADYGSDPAMAAEKAQELILQDNVCAVVGTNSSSTRLAVIPTIEQYDSVLVYNTFYEGENPSPNVLYTNTCPSQQIEDYIPWIIENLGKKIYFIGSDYEFPKNAIAYAKKVLEENGGEIVGEEYVPTGETDFSSAVNKIKQANPDVVFSAVAGNSNVPFYKAYSQYGMNPETTPICSIAAHEGTVKGIGEAAVGTYSCFSYFNTIGTKESDEFVKKYAELFGTDTTVTNQTEAAYHGVYILAEAIEKAGSLKSEDIIKAAAGLEVDTPAGKIKVDEENHHTWLNTYIGKVKSDLTFEIVKKSDGLVQPVIE